VFLAGSSKYHQCPSKTERTESSVSLYPEVLCVPKCSCKHWQLQGFLEYQLDLPGLEYDMSHSLFISVSLPLPSSFPPSPLPFLLLSLPLSIYPPLPPSLLPSLPRLNCLCELPRSFGSFPALEILDLTYNNLTSSSFSANFASLSLPPSLPPSPLPFRPSLYPSLPPSLPPSLLPSVLTQTADSADT